MPLITFLFSLVLMLVGVGFYLGSGRESWTPLIPAMFGVAMLLCAAAAIKKPWRMHAMHAAVLLALLLIVGSFMPLRDPTVLKTFEALLTITLGVVYLVMCVRSFIAARRTRKAEEKVKQAVAK